MANHEKTWLKWLQTIAPIRPSTFRQDFNGVVVDTCDRCRGSATSQCICYVPDIYALAEALSLAAPWGPGGFVCEDEDCDGHNCVTKRRFQLETRVANLEAVINMLLSTCDAREYSSSDQQAARRTARYFLANDR